MAPYGTNVVLFGSALLFLSGIALIIIASYRISAEKTCPNRIIMWWDRIWTVKRVLLLVILSTALTFLIPALVTRATSNKDSRSVQNGATTPIPIQNVGSQEATTIINNNTLVNQTTPPLRGNNRGGKLLWETAVLM